MRTNGTGRQLIFFTSIGLLAGMLRLAPADVMALALDPTTPEAGTAHLLMASASHRFDGGPVRFSGPLRD